MAWARPGRRTTCACRPSDGCGCAPPGPPASAGGTSASDEFALCAARVKVGPATFWAIYDRQADHLLEQTVNPWPGARSEVWSEDGEGAGITFAHNGGSVVRIEAEHPEAGAVRCFLGPDPGLGRGRVPEQPCLRLDPQAGRAGCLRHPDRRPAHRGGDWHRGRVGRLPPRHTVWSWSAGRRAPDGRPVGRLEPGDANDPPERSERAIWVDGEPLEPGPVSFDGLDAVTFDDGSCSTSRPKRSASRPRTAGSCGSPIASRSGRLPERLPAAFGSSAASASGAPGRALVVLTRRIRSPRASATVALRREEVDVVAPGERLQRHQPGWLVSKSRVIACAATCAASAVDGLLPAERRAIEPVVQDHGVVLAPAVVDCEERGDPAVGRGQLRALARQRAARATTVAEIHGQEAPTATGSGPAPGRRRRATPVASVSGSRQQGTGARVISGEQAFTRLRARHAAAGRRHPRRPAPRSAAPAVLDSGESSTGRHPTTVGESIRARCARSAPGQEKALARLAHESHSLGEDDADRVADLRGLPRRLCPGGSGGWRLRSARRPGGWRCRRTRRAARSICSANSPRRQRSSSGSPNGLNGSSITTEDSERPWSAG